MERDRSIWMRLGISLYGTNEEISKVMEGDEEELIRLLKCHSFSVNGDTYIPDNNGDVTSWDLSEFTI